MTEFKINSEIIIRLEPTGRHGYDDAHIYVNGTPYKECFAGELGPIITKLLNSLNTISWEWRYGVFCTIVSELTGTPMKEKLKMEKFSEFINWINQIQDSGRMDELSGKYHAFSSLFKSIKETTIINTETSLIEAKLKEIIFKHYEKNESRDVRIQLDFFCRLIKMLEGTELFNTFEPFIDEKFKNLLMNIESIEMVRLKFSSYAKLISTIKKTTLLKTNQINLENKFDDLLLTVEKVDDSSDDMRDILPDLFQIARDLNLVERKFEELLTIIANLKGDLKRSTFSDFLFNIVQKNNKLLSLKFKVLFNAINKFDEEQRFDYFVNLIQGIKRKKVMTQNYLLIEKKFEEFLDMIENSDTFNKPSYSQITNRGHHFIRLIHAIKGTKLLEKKITTLIDHIDHYQNKDPFFIFIAIYDGIKKNKLLNQHLALIEAKLTKLLKWIDISNDIDFKNDMLWILIGSISGTKLMEINAQLISKIYNDLPLRKQNAFGVFRELNRIIKKKRI